MIRPAGLSRTIRTSTPYRAVRRRLSVSPLCYRALAAALGNPCLARADTGLVVEGFPRSGNSFAEAAFDLVADGGLAIASHTHAAAQIIAAVRRGIPAIVVYRAPVDAVASLTDYYAPHADADDLFRDYAAFHRAVLGVADGVVFAPFARVLADFPSIVAEANRHFGLALPVPVADAAFLAAVEVRRDRLSEARVGRPPSYSEALAPSARTARAARVAALRASLYADDSPPKREAVALHTRLDAIVAARRAGDALTPRAPSPTRPARSGAPPQGGAAWARAPR
ncbi:hypothetical protein [Acuticoccus kandeliae]|uniref:hypothetical protein n=1 Tax=Acuticoccus kandeliae TaxID=2073160 RepID=UPI0013003AED|nr:hypothetical protein [Acuticoccus kandeliae]